MSSAKRVSEALINGEYIVAVVGTLYGETFYYGDFVDAPAKVYKTSVLALEAAQRAHRRLSKHNPERRVRLLHRTFAELTLAQ